MDSILNLKTYNKYSNLINDGLVIVPDGDLSSTINDVDAAYRDKPIMKNGESHEVVLKAGKKVRITSRGSLRNIEIDGKTYDSTEQAACSIYDPYDEYYDLTESISGNLTDFTFVPIVDPATDSIRYTISKYSKGFKKYFDPHKVIKAVYSLNSILFYVKDKDDIRRKYYFKISSISLADLLPSICKAHAAKNGPNCDLYLAFFIREEDLPFTVGGCKEDFYALKDILNKVSFKGTTPLKYMIFTELKNTKSIHIREKEALAYKSAMVLSNLNISRFCKSFKISEDAFNQMIDKEEKEIKDLDGNRVSRKHIKQFLHIIDNVNELSYYEEKNLMWKVKYDDIPSEV